MSSKKAKKMAIWGEGLPPRERLLQQGAKGLSDNELLAIFLRTGLPELNVMQLASQLLITFGSLHGLMSASYEEFCCQPGLGIAKYAQLQAVIELSRRFLSNQLIEGNTLRSPEVTYNYLINLLSQRDREIFVVMFLDNQHRVIATEELFSGTFNSVEVHPREIVRVALRYNAAAIILSHNHPSGVALPSKADKNITYLIQDACHLLDIKVLDHIVIGGSNYVSFAEKGWL